MYLLVIFPYLVLNSLQCFESSHRDFLFPSHPLPLLLGAVPCSCLECYSTFTDNGWSGLNRITFFHIKSLLFLHTSASCHPLTIEQFSLLPILTMENMATVGSQVHVLFVLPPRIDRVNSWPQSQIWKNVKFRTSQPFHESCSYCTEMLPLLKSQGCVCLWSGSSSLQKGKWFPKSAVSTYLMGPNCNVYFKKASRLPLKRFTCHLLLIKNIVDGEWDWAISNHHLGF